MLELDDAFAPALHDTVDAIAHVLGVTELDEASEEAAVSVLISFARTLQRDTLAALIGAGFASGLGGVISSSADESEGATPAQGGPFVRDADGKVRFQTPKK